jgi:hypothetical protein
MWHNPHQKKQKHHRKKDNIGISGRSDRFDRKNSWTFKRSERLVGCGTIFTRRSESIIGRKKILDRRSSCFFTSSRRSERLVGDGTIFTRRSESIMGRRLRISLNGRSDSVDRKTAAPSKEVSAS